MDSVNLIMGQPALSRASTKNTLKSVFLVILMITMSISAGIIEVSRSPVASDEVSEEFDFSSFAVLNPFTWFGDDGQAALESPTQEPMMTGGRSAPATSY